MPHHRPKDAEPQESGEQQEPEPQTSAPTTERPARSMSDILTSIPWRPGAAVAGLIAVGVCCLGANIYTYYDRRQDTKKMQDEYDASIAFLSDGLRPGKMQVDKAMGRTSIILGSDGTTRCVLDNLAFTVERDAQDRIVDTRNYTFGMSLGDHSNLVTVNNAAELTHLLGSNPCVPAPNSPRPDGLR